MSAGTDTQTVKSGLGKKFDKFAGKLVNKADNLISNGKGFNPYPGQPYTDMAPATTDALRQMTALASQGNPFYQPAADFTQGLIGGDYNHDTSGFESLYGQNPNAVAQYGTGIASGATAADAGRRYAGGIASGTDAANAVGQYATGIASGKNGIATESDFRSLLNQVNPEFENNVQNVLGDVRDEIQGQFGGASYGAASNTGYLTKGLGDVATKMRSDNFYNNLAAQRGLTQDITGVQAQNINNQMNAANSLSAEQAGNIGHQLAAAGLISGEQLANIQNQLGAAGMLSGEQQTGFQNNRGILGDIANLNQVSLQNQAQGVGMAPSVYGQQYLPASILAGVGQTQQGQTDKELAALMEQFNIKDMQGWNRLMAGAGALGGAVPGATQNQTTQTPTNPVGQIAGAALGASQIIPSIFNFR